MCDAKIMRNLHAMVLLIFNPQTELAHKSTMKKWLNNDKDDFCKIKYFLYIKLKFLCIIRIYLTMALSLSIILFEYVVIFTSTQKLSLS